MRGDDTVYILGDFCWAKESEWPSYLGPLAGQKVLIRGNHDPRQFSQTTKKFLSDVKDYKEITDNGRHVILSHYPIPFHKADYNPDCWMLYGHVHTTREYDFMVKLRRETKASHTEDGYCVGNLTYCFLRAKSIMTRDVWVPGPHVLRAHAVHHDDRGGVIVQIADNGGKLTQTGKLRRPFAPMARHDFILAVRPLTDNGGHKNSIGFHTLNGFLHLLIVPYLERVIGKVMELGEGDVDDRADRLL